MTSSFYHCMPHLKSHGTPLRSTLPGCLSSEVWQVKKWSIAFIRTSGARSRNISVLVACTKTGVLYHKIQNYAFSAKTFLEELTELKRICIEKGIVKPVFILDNARIYHAKLLKENKEVHMCICLYIHFS